MGRAINMENELERAIGKLTILENRFYILEECLEEIIETIAPLVEKKSETKTKKSNKKWYS